MPCTTLKNVFNELKNHLIDKYPFFFSVSRFDQAIDLLVDFTDIGPKPSKFFSATLGLNLAFPNGIKIGRLINYLVTKQ